LISIEERSGRGWRCGGGGRGLARHQRGHTFGQASFGHRCDGLLLGGCVGNGLSAIGRRIRGLIPLLGQDAVFRRLKNGCFSHDGFAVGVGRGLHGNHDRGHGLGDFRLALGDRLLGGGVGLARDFCGILFGRARIGGGVIPEGDGFFLFHAGFGAALVRQPAIGILDPLGLAAQGLGVSDDDARRAAAHRVGGLFTQLRGARTPIGIEMPLQEVAERVGALARRAAPVDLELGRDLGVELNRAHARPVRR